MAAVVTASFLDPTDSTKKRRRIIEPNSSENSCSEGWAELPKDILDSILGKLTLLSDYDRFWAVCVTWRKASLDVYNRHCRFETIVSSSSSSSVPLLLLPSPQRQEQYWTSSLYDVVQRKMVMQDLIKLPALPNSRGRCCGSSHGWLIIADDSLTITLPFYLGGGGQYRGGIIRLPPIHYPPELRFFTRIDDDEYISELSICKAVLSADPALAPDDYVVMVIYGFCKSLAFIKSGDRDWTYLPRSEFLYCDDVLYRNGIIYVVAAGGDLFYCDVTNPVPKLRKVAPPPPSLPTLAHLYPFFYIVESPEHDLMIVCRILVSSSSLGDNDHEHTFRTTGFKVFKLLVLGRKTAWVQMKSLGDKVLFLGDNHSTCASLTSRGFSEFQPNSIYFTDHALSYYTFEPDTLRVPADMGVFNLKDQRFRQCYDLNDNLSHLVRIPTPVWFLPSFPGNWA